MHRLNSLIFGKTSQAAKIKQIYINLILPTVIMYALTSTVSCSCPENYESFGGKQCIMINHDHKMSWSAAKSFCEEKKAKLIQPKRNSSYRKLIKFLKAKEQIRNYWVGGFFLNHKWHWIDQSPFTQNLDIHG